MFKVIVPIAAAVLYLPLIFGYIPLMIGAVGSVVVVGVLCYWWGVARSYRRPAPASFAIGGWSAASVVVFAALCVLGAWAAVAIAALSPDTASKSTKTAAGLGTAAVAAITGALLDKQPSWGSGAMAKRCLQKRFTAWFPSQPASPPEGITAWQAVSSAFFGASADQWTYKFRRDLFQTVKAARAVGGFHGGDHWQDALPADERPPVQP